MAERYMNIRYEGENRHYPLLLSYAISTHVPIYAPPNRTTPLLHAENCLSVSWPRRSQYTASSYMSAVHNERNEYLPCSQSRTQPRST